MDKWLHAQFKVAENLLEAVDRNISKNVQQGPAGNDEWKPGSPPHVQELPGTDKVGQQSTFPVPPRQGLGTDFTRINSSDLAYAHSCGAGSLSNSQLSVEEAAPVAAELGPNPPSFDSLTRSADTASTLIQDNSVPSGPAAGAALQEQTPRPTPAQDFAVSLPLPTAVDTSAAFQSNASDLDQADPMAGGSNRESRLARLLEHLKRRLDEQRVENQQLEELLQKAEARAAEHAVQAQRLEADANKAIEDRQSLESTFAAQLTAKDVEASRLRSSLDAAQRQIAVLETANAALEERNAGLMQGQESVEAGMLIALKSELKSVEQQLESERRQHQATKVGASSRQEDLERHLADSAAALSGMQRKLEQAETRHLEMEERLALVQADLKRAVEQPDISSQARSDGTPPARSASMGFDGPSMEVESLREEVARSRAALQAAEKARRMSETAAANLRQELAELRAGTNHPTSQLEHEVKEMSEMLYIKQTQLERLAAEKASQQIVLERDLMAAREEIQRLRNSSQQQRYDARHTNDALIPMDALGEPYQRLARHNKLGTAVTTVASFLDITTTRFVYLLRHYPLGRLIVFVYLIFVHLFLYYLTIRLQHLAMKQEGAIAAALAHEHTLPGHSRALGS